MNKLLIAIFENEASAQAGLKALRAVHAAGDITLYATGILAKDAHGTVSVLKSLDTGPLTTVTGLAVGSLIGLLGGPVGVAVGAVTGTVVGAVRDFWVAGVGLDFVEEALLHLQPGKVALLAELEEEWILPVDTALEAAGGVVFRRTRSELAEAQFDHDLASMKAEIKQLEGEAQHATGAVQASLHRKLTAARSGLASAVQRARHRVDALGQEAEAKAQAMKSQLEDARGDAKARIEGRMKRVKSGFHERGAKLSHAWSLTKEALAV